MTRDISRTRTVVLLASLSFLAAVIAHAHPRKVFSSLNVHEWGTFTSSSSAQKSAAPNSPAALTPSLEMIQAERADAIWRDAHVRHPELPRVEIEPPARLAA